MQLEIIKYCAEECFRQGSGEVSVYDMCNAWEYAQSIQGMIDGSPPESIPALSPDMIEHLGKLVEPAKNANGFRTVPIGVSDGFNWIEKAQWQRVPDLLTQLIESYYAGNLAPIKTPVPNTDWFKVDRGHKLAQTAEDQFYYEYENIHPFVDGNGRTGKIIYNYLLGRLDNPILPPNYWNSSNP